MPPRIDPATQHLYCRCCGTADQQRLVHRPDEPGNPNICHSCDELIRCLLDVERAFVDYRDNLRPLGGFLTAVLQGDLFQAANRADSLNGRYLVAIAGWVYNNLPADIYGTVEKVRNHLAGKSETYMRACWAGNGKEGSR